jgi:hypothetical protein
LHTALEALAFDNAALAFLLLRNKFRLRPCPMVAQLKRTANDTCPLPARAIAKFADVSASFDQLRAQPVRGFFGKREKWVR